MILSFKIFVMVFLNSITSLIAYWIFNISPYEWTRSISRNVAIITFTFLTGLGIGMLTGRAT